MTGVSFVVDENGKETAVQIDLSVWGDLWEDFYDAMLVKSREGESTISLEELKKELEIVSVPSGSV